MKFIFLALILVLGLAASVAFVGSKKKSINQKEESEVLRYDAQDFPEHGVSLIVPSDPAFGHLLTKLESAPILDPYSVLLKNTSNRAVVGYSLQWQCFDGAPETSHRSLSNDRNLNRIVSWVFLHGEESNRKAAINGSEDVVKPHSTWLISSDGSARSLGLNRVEVPFAKTPDASYGGGALNGCASMTVIADGIFFEDGTFIGPDTNALFTRVKSEMDARHELFQEIDNDLKSGKKVEEIFKELERIRDAEVVRLGERPSADDLRAFFRNLFAKDLLGRKEFFGIDKAIEDIQLQLSKPWVTLRKLS
ncbi:MAG TPA: hypothetical protein VNO50_18795 [Pyrinomonadaceae bacterium]|nr:hypothetical protein [Pyrinomonadaceae bacterium]